MISNVLLPLGILAVVGAVVWLLRQATRWLAGVPESGDLSDCSELSHPREGED